MLFESVIKNQEVKEKEPRSRKQKAHWFDRTINAFEVLGRCCFYAAGIGLCGLTWYVIGVIFLSCGGPNG